MCIVFQFFKGSRNGWFADIGRFKHTTISLLYCNREYKQTKVPLYATSHFLISDLVGQLVVFIKISLAASMLKIFHIKILIKIWCFPSNLWGCWGQRRSEKVSKYHIWHHCHYSSYSQNCNWNQKLDKQWVCSRLVCSYSLLQYKKEILVCLGGDLKKRTFNIAIVT